MSQDVVADTLNMLVNAKKANKLVVETKKYNKLLLSVLAIAKLKGYVKSYSAKTGTLVIEIEKLNDCKAIKPRFTVSTDQIEKYAKRYLPAKNIGVMIISTSQGIMTHTTAMDKKIGGSLIAYIY
tara:strand:- start:5764 stop:6138 length:375 start_codon:yes stop_codon:yes gene_type:complete